MTITVPVLIYGLMLYSIGLGVGIRYVHKHRFKTGQELYMYWIRVVTFLFVFNVFLVLAGCYPTS